MPLIQHIDLCTKIVHKLSIFLTIDVKILRNRPLRLSIIAGLSFAYYINDNGKTYEKNHHAILNP